MGFIEMTLISHVAAKLKIYKKFVVYKKVSVQNLGLLPPGPARPILPCPAPPRRTAPAGRKKTVAHTVFTVQGRDRRASRSRREGVGRRRLPETCSRQAEGACGAARHAARTLGVSSQRPHAAPRRQRFRAGESCPSPGPAPRVLGAAWPHPRGTVRTWSLDWTRTARPRRAMGRT